MYDTGKVLGACTAGAAATICGASVLPQTGADTAIQIAVAAAAGLASWAVVYMTATKFGGR